MMAAWTLLAALCLSAVVNAQEQLPPHFLDTGRFYNFLPRGNLSSWTFNEGFAVEHNSSACRTGGGCFISPGLSELRRSLSISELYAKFPRSYVLGNDPFLSLVAWSRASSQGQYNLTIIMEALAANGTTVHTSRRSHVSSDTAAWRGTRVGFWFSDITEEPAALRLTVTGTDISSFFVDDVGFLLVLDEPAVAEQNLLPNGNFEGEIELRDQSGYNWTVVKKGGGTGSPPQPALYSGIYNGYGMFGVHRRGYVASYSEGRIKTTTGLLTNMFPYNTEFKLQWLWKIDGGCRVSRLILKFFDSGMSLITSVEKNYVFGTGTYTGWRGDATKTTLNRTQAETVAYIEVEIISQDQLNWYGLYGPKYDGLLLSVRNVGVPTTTATTGTTATTAMTAMTATTGTTGTTTKTITGSSTGTIAITATTVVIASTGIKTTAASMFSTTAVTTALSTASASSASVDSAIDSSSLPNFVLVCIIIGTIACVIVICAASFVSLSKLVRSADSQILTALDDMQGLSDDSGCSDATQARTLGEEERYDKSPAITPNAGTYYAKTPTAVNHVSDVNDHADVYDKTPVAKALTNASCPDDVYGKTPVVRISTDTPQQQDNVGGNKFGVEISRDSGESNHDTYGKTPVHTPPTSADTNGSPFDLVPHVLMPTEQGSRNESLPMVYGKTPALQHT